MDEDELIPTLGGEAEFVRVPDGGGGGGDGGGRRDLTMKLIEEQMKEMKNIIAAMKKEIEHLKLENETLKKDKSQHQEQDKKETWGGGVRTYGRREGSGRMTLGRIGRDEMRRRMSTTNATPTTMVNGIRSLEEMERVTGQREYGGAETTTDATKW